ncbi:NYN domain-containing protein [Dietzia sp. Alg238-R159]|uniref:NYN domain-containing protein n=1 Tax=Dietzia sp. Alg238-R159 TaxID=2305986 RepID=UPI0013D736E2|nr:NYN domain-containing protein [Dietzia sp. Alg238-R159]
MPSVHFFIDYQNLHLSVREAFNPPQGTPPDTYLIHPARFAEEVMKVRREVLPGLRTNAWPAAAEEELTEIHVYRGQPDSTRQKMPASKNKAQAAEWTRDRRVTVHSRALRYPRDWPEERAREKGVDVMLACHFVRHAIEKRADTLILASRDTDLLPALEMARELGVRVETAMWKDASRLRLKGDPLWSTLLDIRGYLASKDTRQY